MIPHKAILIGVYYHDNGPTMTTMAIPLDNGDYKDAKDGTIYPKYAVIADWVQTKALFPIIFDMTDEEAMQSFDFSVFKKIREEQKVAQLEANLKYFLNAENKQMPMKEYLAKNNQGEKDERSVATDAQ